MRPMIFFRGAIVRHESSSGVLLLRRKRKHHAALSACETFGAPFTPRPAATDFVEEGTRLSLAGMEIEVLHLPGHTPGGVGYRIENALFTGDTIFHRGYGRTDMPGGDFSALRASLRRILHMHEDLILYPGHGPATTISQERGF